MLGSRTQHKLNGILFNKHYYADKIKESEMGGTCSTHNAHTYAPTHPHAYVTSLSRNDRIRPEHHWRPKTFDWRLDLKWRSEVFFFLILAFQSVRYRHTPRSQKWTGQLGQYRLWQGTGYYGPIAGKMRHFIFCKASGPALRSLSLPFNWYQALNPYTKRPGHKSFQLPPYNARI